MRLLIFMLCFVCSTAWAELKLEVNQGHTKPLPIAVLEFEGDTQEEKDLAKKMAKVIKDDLKSTGLFEIIPSSGFIQEKVDFDMTPRFQDWRLIKANALINGKIKVLEGGKISTGFRLWDVYASQAMTHSAFKTDKKYWRRTAHLVADAIYKRITGEQGYFDTRIVYVSETGGQLARKRKLAIMDQDGANHKFLTDGEKTVITPRFSPMMQTITYMTYENKIPKVFTLDLETGNQKLVGQFPGLTYAPRFSPDGKSVIMSQAFEGSSSIYVMNLETKRVKRLTKGRFIDTSPCYSPDGEKIAFNSDRSGQKQLYTMDAKGGNIKRISYGSGVYATPVWSPRGDLIAFNKMEKGTFYIGVMKPDGTDERLVSSGYMVEGPTWAPNGRTIMFGRQGKSHKDGKQDRAELVVIDITGRNERVLKTPLDASDPAWSPSLPLTIK